MTNDNVLKKVRDIYGFIQENLYLNRPDMKIGEGSFNSALLLGFLTALNQGKEIIMGEPGLGKTTSAEYICAMIYRFPLGLLWASVVAGHPEQTEEKIIGRPDLGRLNQGEEVVVWSYFSQLPVKIVDEINRLPETKQSIILDGVDRGKWEYMNNVIINEEYCLFATANYQDRGTNTLIAPMVDRFDVMVESKHPGPNMAMMISMKDRYDNLLRNIEYERKFNEILSEREAHHKKMKLIEDLCNRFGDYMEKEFQIKMLTCEEREKIRDSIRKIPIDLDANAFLRTVIAELSFCHKYGQKRTNEQCEEGCHYSGYICYHIKNCISNRFPISARTYAQSLAWFMGDKEVNVEHLKTVIPYTLAHRLQWRDEYVSQKQSHIRSNSLQIHVAKEMVKELYQRYNEQSTHIKSALAAAYESLSGNEIAPVEGDHPIYTEIKRDMEGDRRTATHFNDFRDYPYEKREIPLDHMIEPKRKVMDQIIEGYAKCLQTDAENLVNALEEGEIIEAYSVAEKTLRAFDYDIDDIEEFCLELNKEDGRRISWQISGLTGIYLSALCNNVRDEKIHLNVRTIKQKIDFLGYRLPEGKTLVLEGDVGSFVGAGLCGGDLFVEGSTGNWAGAAMQEGRLFISHQAGLNTGEWKSGGEIHVEAGIGSLGIHITGGFIYQAGQIKKYG
jgi:MoxR-like ATPase